MKLICCIAIYEEITCNELLKLYTIILSIANIAMLEFPLKKSILQRKRVVIKRATS